VAQVHAVRAGGDPPPGRLTPHTPRQLSSCADLRFDPAEMGHGKEKSDGYGMSIGLERWCFLLFDAVERSLRDYGNRRAGPRDAWRRNVLRERTRPRFPAATVNAPTSIGWMATAMICAPAFSGQSGAHFNNRFVQTRKLPGRR